MNKSFHALTLAAALLGTPCCVPLRKDALPSSDPPLPAKYPLGDGAKSSALIGWKEYFKDPNLTSLISTALQNNQELNILMQEIAVSKAEVLGRKGAIFPFVRLGGGAGLDKVGKYTREGAVEENLEIKPERRFPDPLTNFGFSADFDWEVDIWRKLRNERDAAVKRYLDHAGRAGTSW
jgi:multidrug efflux system outer membrane protein